MKTIGEVVWVATGLAKLPVNDNVNVPPVAFASVTVSLSFGLRATVAFPDPIVGSACRAAWTVAALESSGRGMVVCPLKVSVNVPPVGAFVPVLAGLQAGELVVVSGAFRLKAEHGKAAAQHEH